MRKWSKKHLTHIKGSGVYNKILIVEQETDRIVCEFPGFYDRDENASQILSDVERLLELNDIGYRKKIK
jgi:hypothetical protein